MTVVGLAQIGSRPGEPEANRDSGLDAARRLFNRPALRPAEPQINSGVPSCAEQLGQARESATTPSKHAAPRIVGR